MDTEIQTRRKAKQQLSKSWKQSVSFLTYISITKFLHLSVSAKCNDVGARHARKLSWMDRHHAASLTLLDMDKIVVNLLSVSLTDVEIQLLSKGLPSQFSFHPNVLIQLMSGLLLKMVFNQAAPGVHSNLTRLKHRLRSLCYTYIYNLPSDSSPLSVSEDAAFKKTI